MCNMNFEISFIALFKRVLKTDFLQDGTNFSVLNKSGLNSDVAFDSYSPGSDRCLGIECHRFHDDDLSEKSQDKQNQSLNQSHPRRKTSVDDIEKQIENVEGVQAAPKSHKKLGLA